MTYTTQPLDLGTCGATLYCIIHEGNLSSSLLWCVVTPDNDTSVTHAHTTGLWWHVYYQ